MAAVIRLFMAAGGALAWVVGQQVVDVAARVPEYRDNIDGKLESVRSIGKLRGFVDLIAGFQQEIFNSSLQPAGTENGEKSAQLPRGARSVPSSCKLNQLLLHWSREFSVP